MYQVNLEKLPRETLIELVKMYSRNWQTLDGLWFGNVETECSLETAVKIDLQNWKKQAVLEATRIKKVLRIKSGSLNSMLTVLSMMSWQLTSPLFEVEYESEKRIVFVYSKCVVQESRTRNLKPVFPCKEMKLTLLRGIARIIEPRVIVKCLHAPPDAKVGNSWCKWELTLPE